MSQHHYKTALPDGTPVAVMAGWDRPLQQFFLHVDAAPDAEREDYRYNSLDDPGSSFSFGWEYFAKQLEALGVELPREMHDMIRQDKEDNVGNKVHDWGSDCKVQELCPDAALQVSLVDFTGMGFADPSRHAAEVLAFTKQTRLRMDTDTRQEVREWSNERLEEELRYMANTIPSSWEFINYTFLVNNVTRAFTHQFVRTRTGSYAQQTMRVLDVGGWTYGTGPTVAEDEDRQFIYDATMEGIARAYDELIAAGAKIEDARGVLPTNIHTNIVARFDLRALADTARKRASGRTQGEYRSVLDGMLDAVRAVHPWTALFFDRTFDAAARDLEAAVRALSLPEAQTTDLVKLIDVMRTTS